jgi:threonine/homoserine efflux transporter RhtA
MERLNLKRYQYVLGIFLMLTGILLLVLIKSPVQYLGIAFIVMAYFYLVYIVFMKFTGPDDEHFKSRIRDEMMKYQYRK